MVIIEKKIYSQQSRGICNSPGKNNKRDQCAVYNYSTFHDFINGKAMPSNGRSGYPRRGCCGRLLRRMFDFIVKEVFGQSRVLSSADDVGITIVLRLFSDVVNFGASMKSRAAEEWRKKR